MKDRLCCGTPIKTKRVAPTVSAPLHLILQAPSPASHEWKRVAGVKTAKGGLCQVCHLVVDGPGVRCKSCGLNAHPQCGNHYPANYNLNPFSGATANNPTASANKNNPVETKSLFLRGTLNNNSVRSSSRQNPHQQQADHCFEPRIKKLLQVPESEQCESEEHHSANSTRFSSSCGDSVAASTAIVVGTATVSTETPRSESKTPEITITPGFEQEGGGGDADDEEEPGRALLLSSSASVGDSGFAGLLGEQDPDDSNRSNSNFNFNLSNRRGDSQSIGTRENSNEPDNETNSNNSNSTQQCHTNRNSGQSQIGSVSQDDANHNRIKYVDGPLDGAPYALVNPLVKQKTPSSADSGISVDQMKDLDRLLSALVQEAESIPDIPYHAREDSLPFSYTAQNVPGVTTQKQLQQASRRHVSLSAVPPNYHQQYSPSTSTSHPSQHYYSYNPPNSAPARSTYQQQDFTDSPHHQQPPPPRYSQIQSHPTNTNQRHQQNVQLSIEEQILSPEPTSNYARPQYQQQQPSHYGNRTQAGGHSQLRESASTTNFGSGTTGNGNNGAVTRRLRSQSADGRHTHESEDAEEWLARQMKRLQEKRAGSHTMKNDWLAELKRALPTEKAREQQNNDFRPSFSSGRAGSIVHNVPISGGGGGRSNVSTPGPYSSDDEEIDREVEMFQRGRKVQRHFSENTYDRSVVTSRSKRAPSQQSQQSDVVDTPGFPICPPTPYLNRPVSPGKPPRSPKLLRRSHSSISATPTTPMMSEFGGGGGVSGHLSVERAQTPVNPRPVFMGESEVKFARDLSTFWYKANASREETIAALRYQPTGMFLIRNSNSFPGAYGLAIKVNDSTTTEESVRHFLIEPTKYGVRLRGSTVEPVFGSLSALVYAHSVEPLALPTTLCLPINDSVLPTSQSQSTTAHLLAQGAACQLLFLNLVGVECVTGDEAVDRAVTLAYNVSQPTVVSLRLSKQGLTLTDVFRQRFFRLHFPLLGISYAAQDPRGRSIVYGSSVRKVFAVVARAPNASDNSCVVLSELEEGQPCNAIVAFFQRVIAWQH